MQKLNFLKLVALLYICIFSTSCSKENETAIKWRYANALLSTTRNPFDCISPNSKEKALLDISASAIELGDTAAPNSLDIGAQKLLGNGIYRDINKESFPICIPKDIVERVGLAFKTRGGFGKGRLVEYQIALASKLIHPDENIIADIAESAFARTPQQSEIFHDEDIRPYARTVLASFGHSSSQYASLAFQQIEADTPMGTGAAQIAAAAGHPNALPKVISLIDGIINNLDIDKPIPLAQRDRLYELAWAIAYSGEAGKAYVSSLNKIMSKRVESLAPPFGIVSAYPKQMCKVIKYIEGQETINKYAYCTNEKIPYEQ